jgi:hypothetical protein
VYSVLDTPVKRAKGNDGRPRPSGRLTAKTPTPSPDRATAYDTIVVESNRKYSSLLEARQSTPARTPTRADLIHDALAANPEGLRSNDVFEWLRENRPHAYRECDEGKFKIDVRKALSAQSTKATPTVLKSRDDGSGGSRFIWKLAPAERQTPRLFVPTNLSRTEVEGIHEDIRTSASPKRDLIRAETRSTTLATVQGHNSRSGHNTQVTETEAGAVERVEEAEYMVSDSNNNTGDFAHQPPRMSSEPIATTSSELPVLVQPQVPIQDEIEAEAVITIQSSEASDTEGTRKPGDESEESCDSDPEAQLRYGKLVSRLHKLKTQRDRRKREIAADRNALPDMETLGKNVEQATQKVTELTRMLEEARQIAASACSAREATINKTDEIETAEQELEQLIADHKVLRAQLDNLID